MVSNTILSNFSLLILGKECFFLKGKLIIRWGHWSGVQRPNSDVAKSFSKWPSLVILKSKTATKIVSKILHLIEVFGREELTKVLGRRLDEPIFVAALLFRTPRRSHFEKDKRRVQLYWTNGSEYWLKKRKGTYWNFLILYFLCHKYRRSQLETSK